jgi:hypothetical protein
MESEIATFAVNQFILECGELARRLDSVNTRDGQSAMSSTVEKGRDDYDQLLRTRDALPTTSIDAPFLQLILDGLLARLQFLERRATLPIFRYANQTAS